MFQQGERHTPLSYNYVHPESTYKNWQMIIHSAWTKEIKPDEACGMWMFDQPLPRFECDCYDCLRKIKNHEEKATSKMLFWLGEKIATMKKRQQRTAIVQTQGHGLQYSILQYEEAFDLVLKRFNMLL
jgi:hypothetical protein